MNEKIFIQLCEIALAMASIVGIFFILAASWYDLRMINTKKQIQMALSKTTKRRQMPISILIYARNDLDSLKLCLKSIDASQYTNYKVIVADNASTDGTKKYLAQYKQLHPALSLLTYHAKTTTDRPTLLRRAVNKDASSQLVVLIEATAIITPTLLYESAARFTANSSLDALQLRALPADDLSIASALTYFKALTKNIIYKSFARSALMLGHNETAALVIRRSVFKKVTTIRKMKIDYASTIAHAQSSRTVSTAIERQQSVTSSRWVQMFGLVSTVAGLSLGLTIITYFIYTAMTLQSNILLTLSWIIVSLWMLAIIWSDDVYKLDRRIELTFAAPFMYFIFYAQMGYAVFVSLWRLIKFIRLPAVSLGTIHQAIQLELYSTRY